MATKCDIAFFNNKILEFAGFRKSGSTKWRKPGTLSHDNLLEIRKVLKHKQTEPQMLQ